jgi:transcriptional regulator GlxA family with amidase domain
LYEGVQLSAALGLTDILAMANRVAESMAGQAAALIRVTHWAPDGTGSARCTYASHHGPRTTPAMLVVPPTPGVVPSPEVPISVAPWLAARHKSGTAVASVCSGAFLVAEAGIFRRRAISTHWSCADELTARYPHLRIDVGARLIDHGDVLSAGGFLAWVDVGLNLVERFLGTMIARETARFLSVENSTRVPALTGFPIALNHGDELIHEAQRWAHVRDGRHVSLGAMANAAGLERRTFLRRFLSATGMTPIAYCREVRIARARELLESSTKPIKEIAWLAGYGDPASFARAFSRAAGVSPTRFRRRSLSRAKRRENGT